MTEAKSSAPVADQTQMTPIASADRTLQLEINGLLAVKESLNNGLQDQFKAAVETILKASGRVIVSGMGKSGHVGNKLAATLASTGTPSFFVHPAEASHGDLGMITKDDVVIALSWSGDTAELSSLLAYTRRFGVSMIAITSKNNSALGRNADIVLALPREEEACPHGLAPTTSTTMQLALSDALAIALLEARGFTAEHFGVYHPGGSLGANLKYVRDLMRKGNAMPLVESGINMTDGLILMTEKGVGCLGIVGQDGELVGMVTDGDLRRHAQDNLLELTVDQVMTAGPTVVSPDILVSKAMEILSQGKINVIFAVEEGRPVGVLHVQDLIQQGVV
ncbi:KpsF/GutQ family sugar-phosphate isomerase [Coralliovum pocilloporae]|uniref:KpsF/GutQ family sugar-phosphate isomerase n=1 Tax=Coralliovum pocilloporae TaxID=3066369 RepID=UPI003306ADA2